MSIFLNRIDAAPTFSLDTLLAQWIWVLVDTLNENLSEIQDSFNILKAQSYTDTEIANLEAQGALENGIILYDSVNNVYVGKQNNTLVKFTTSTYP